MRKKATPPGDFASKIGRRLRWLREIQDLSLKELAARANTTGKTLQRYERGGLQVPLNILELLAAGLNVSPSRLCGPLADFAWLVQEQVGQIEAPNVLISKDPDVAKTA